MVVKATRSVPKCCQEPMDYIGRTEATSPTCDHVIVSDVYKCDTCRSGQAVPTEWRERRPEKPPAAPQERTKPQRSVPDPLKRRMRMNGFGYGTDEI